MPNVVVVALDPTSVQLALTGVYVHQVESPEEGERAIAQWIEEDVQLLIVGESLRPTFSESFRERLNRHRGKPLVVYCPAFENESADVDAYLAAVLKPAIGYEIRLD